MTSLYSFCSSNFVCIKPSSSALSNKTAPFYEAISNLLPNEVPKLASSSLIFHFSFALSDKLAPANSNSVKY
jgi:hypothetical protein